MVRDDAPPRCLPAAGLRRGAPASRESWKPVGAWRGPPGRGAASGLPRAVSSALLLLAVPSGPASQRAGVAESSETTHAQPAGPGFPFEAPSHAATTRSRMASIMPRTDGASAHRLGDVLRLGQLSLGPRDVDHR